MQEHYDETRVRAAEKTGVMRYVLAVSLALAVVCLTTVVITVT